MDANGLMTLALGLREPWQVTSIELDAEKKQVDIHVDFPRGSTFPCPVCAKPSKVHDTSDQTWRHLNFFEHVCYLHARQPRTTCSGHGVKTVDVPWARPGANFTLLFEAMVVQLGMNGLTPNAIGRIVGEYDALIWRILKHYVGQAQARASHAGVTRIGVDETSRAKGHVYVTLFADLEKKRVLTVTEGKDNETVTTFKEDFVAHGGEPSKVTDFSLDMSTAFVKGIRREFPEAELTFDKFHVVKLMNDAVDAVRREEQRTEPQLKKTRYLWLKNEENHDDRYREQFSVLKNSALKTARAWRIKTALQDLYRTEVASAEDVEPMFKRWYFWCTHSRLPPIAKAARTLKDNLRGVLRWFASRITNGLLEGINSLVQAAKARSRGFRNVDNMATIIYLLLAKLDFNLPRVLPASTHER
jgi:transposase